MPRARRITGTNSATAAEVRGSVRVETGKIFRCLTCMCSIEHYFMFNEIPEFDLYYVAYLKDDPAKEPVADIVCRNAARLYVKVRIDRFCIDLRLCRPKGTAVRDTTGMPKRRRTHGDGED